MKKYGFILLVVVVTTLAILELIPQKHENPAVSMEPTWNQAETRALAKRACFDCHSNETKWPAYSTHGPIAWVIRRDVQKGRNALNFSEWDRPQNEVQELGEAIASGKMPPRIYLQAHPEARLTAAERAALITGLEHTTAAKTRQISSVKHP